MAKVARLRPRRHDAATAALQLCLEIGLSDAARDEIAERLNTYDAPNWTAYTMVSHDNLRLLLKAINEGPRPLATLAVWTAAVARAGRAELGEPSEIMASRQTLADDAGIRPNEVSTAMSRLVELGAVVTVPGKRGRWALHPSLAFRGSLAARSAAEARAEPVQLRLVGD